MNEEIEQLRYAVQILRDVFGEDVKALVVTPKGYNKLRLLATSIDFEIKGAHQPIEFTPLPVRVEL